MVRRNSCPKIGRVFRGSGPRPTSSRLPILRGRPVLTKPNNLVLVKRLQHEEEQLVKKKNWSKPDRPRRAGGPIGDAGNKRMWKSTSVRLLGRKDRGRPDLRVRGEQGILRYLWTARTFLRHHDHPSAPAFRTQGSPGAAGAAPGGWTPATRRPAGFPRSDRPRSPGPP